MWLKSASAPTVLGHKDPRSTQRYAHLEVDTRGAAIETIGKAEKRTRTPRSPEITKPAEAGFVIDSLAERVSACSVLHGVLYVFQINRLINGLHSSPVSGSSLPHPQVPCRIDDILDDT
ncbi:MAG: hypothetical protein M0Z99_27210 [Betaproteobacteria bacterium]|nr:hypothetical protein [Betaproteobacteria bacterium]